MSDTDFDAEKTLITKSAFNPGSAGQVDSAENFVPASGSLGSSGLSSFDGPWFIERQTLDIHYSRVPREWAASANVNLSSTSTDHGGVAETLLLFYCVASYQADIVNQTFNSSSVQQPQQFTINAASGDINGITYGAITSATLGPMGSIITSQPYIRRVPYVSGSTQVSANEYVVASNFGALRDYVVANNTILVNAEAVDAQPYLYDMLFHKDFGCAPGTGRYGHTYNFGYNGKPRSEIIRAYAIPGAYSTDKESAAQIAAFIDNVASKLTTETLFAWPIVNLEDSPQSAVLNPAKDTGLPGYDVNRHA